MGEPNNVRDALYNAANSGDKFKQLKGSWGETSTSDRERVAATRRTLIRFLEDLDGDLSVAELREALGEQGDPEL